METKSRQEQGFTLIELIVVVAIIGMLATLLTPAFGRVADKAKGVACAANLRAVFVAVQNFAQDNGNRLPRIEPFANDPVYTDELAPSLLVALAPYGVTEQALNCPADKKDFAETGSSYEWRPIFDQELVSNPKRITRDENAPLRAIPPQFVMLARDTSRNHNGRSNRLYLDGRVTSGKLRR